MSEEVHYAESLIRAWLAEALAFAVAQGGEKAKSVAWDINHKFCELMKGPRA